MNLPHHSLTLLATTLASRFPDSHPSIHYQCRTKFLRNDLPSAVGLPQRLDLRLLPGDFGDPNVMSPVAKRVLDECVRQDCAETIDIFLFLSGHGMGKTKTLFDIASQRFTILFDASSIKSHTDMLELWNNLQMIINPQRGNNSVSSSYLYN